MGTLRSNQINNLVSEKGLELSCFHSNQNLLSDPDSKWNLDPERGLLLRDTTISDTGQYQCVGTMNNVSDWEYFQIYVKGTQFQQTRLASSKNCRSIKRIEL